MSEVVKIAVECTYVQGEINESKGEEWSSKGMDRCPLTLPLIPFAKAQRAWHCMVLV
jgi:hypothetical protein